MELNPHNHSILSKLIENSSNLKKEQISDILILYEEEVTYLGDSCMCFDKYRYIKSFLNEANIHINFKNTKGSRIYKSLLENNPYLDKVTESLDWQALDMDRYQIIFCVSYREDDLLSFITETYGAQILNGRWRGALFSLSALLLKYESYQRFIFPVYTELVNFLIKQRPGELYVSPAERLWANEWMEAKGINNDDQLFVIIDSSSSKEKLLQISVYFDFISKLLEQPKTKLLIFDEKNIGKDVFYYEWLGREFERRIIFSKRQTLREDLSLLSSSYVKMIFGPCTGLMHCASSIYNFFKATMLPRPFIPLIVVYTGEYTKGNFDANFWWGNAPLVKCLLLDKKDNQKQLVLLSDIENAASTKPLPCSEYNSSLLRDFVFNTLNNMKLNSIKL